MGAEKNTTKSTSTTKSSMTKSKRAGLLFPVGRVNRLMRKGRYAERIAAGAPVYLASVLEYLTAEVIELSGKAAIDNKKKRISPRHIRLAVGHDQELNELLSNVTISGGGVIPFINSALLPKVKAKKEVAAAVSN